MVLVANIINNAPFLANRLERSIIPLIMCSTTHRNESRVDGTETAIDTWPDSVVKRIGFFLYIVVNC